MANNFVTNKENGQGKDFDRSVNERLKLIRQTLKMSQAKFCGGIFLTNGHYAELELGNRRINDRTIKLICVMYGVNERYLRTGNGEMFNPEVNPTLDRLNQLFQDLPDEFQDYVFKQLEALNQLCGSRKGHDH